MEYVFNQLLGNHVVQSKPGRKVSGSALQLLVCLIKSVGGKILIFCFCQQSIQLALNLSCRLMEYCESVPLVTGH